MLRDSSGNPCLPTPAYPQLPHWVLEEVERIGERQREKEGRWAERQAEGRQEWGQGEQPARPPQSPGQAPRGAPLCSSPSPTSVMGEEGSSGQPPPAQSEYNQCLSASTLGSGCKANGHPLRAPISTPAPAPWTLHKLVMVLHRFGNQRPHRCEHVGPGPAREGGLGHHAACMGGVCSPEGEPQPRGSPGICPLGSQCPSLTHSPLLGEVMVRGALGDHLAQASQESGPEPRDTLDLGTQLHLLVYALVSRTFIRISKGSLPLKF